MTNKTIFDLGVASAPVADSDLLLVGQNGGLKKITFTNLLLRALRITTLTTTGQAAVGGVLIDAQPAPDTVSTTSTLSASNVQKRILISSPAAAITLTLPTGTTLETVAVMTVDMAFMFTIINTSANAITVAANTGVTIVGAATVAANTSATFRFRETALNTFVAYRVA